MRRNAPRSEAPELTTGAMVYNRYPRCYPATRASLLSPTRREAARPFRIADRAREVGVPMITVPFDTLATVEKLEAVLGRIRIREEKKVRRAQELIASRLSVKKLLARIGMA